MSVGLLSVAKIFVEGVHRKSCQLSVLHPLGSGQAKNSFQLNISRVDFWHRSAAHFLRQRMPSFVISTRTPASESSARMASEALKSRALRAAFIESIFFSISASESCPD